VGYTLIVGTLLVMILLTSVDTALRPIITKTAAYQSRILATDIVNGAIEHALTDENVTYDKLVHLNYGENGQIAGIETDVVSVNRMKSRAALEINEALREMGERKLAVAAGTLSGVQMLYGRGPDVNVISRPKGFADVRVASEFKSAGINQTLHKIIITVSVDVSAIIPGYTASTTAETEFIAAETVIVGVVPEAYTYIVSVPDNVVDNVNDFGSMSHYEANN
jgi:sporulation protein YunB